MKFRWVVGDGVCLEQVFSTWTQMYPQENICKIELAPDENYAFDLTALDELDSKLGVMFVAFDERFGNFKRMELMQAVMERGFKLESFVSPSAIVASDVILGPNTFIGNGVVLGTGSRIDFNAVLCDGVRLGMRVHLRSSCWLEAGVLVGDGAEIGAHTIVRMGAVVGARVKIGKHCELGWAQRYDKAVAAKTIFDARYPEPIVIHGV